MDWKFVLLVAGGGAIGSFLRAFLGFICKIWLPWPTLLINIIGAFLIGICLKHWEQNGENELFRAFWIIGLCGGFTTFSTFGIEILQFFRQSEWLLGSIYLLVSLAGTVAAILLGFRFYTFIQS